VADVEVMESRRGEGHAGRARERGGRGRSGHPEAELEHECNAAFARGYESLEGGAGELD
jgi:hypothetical protein